MQWLIDANQHDFDNSRQRSVIVLVILSPPNVFYQTHHHWHHGIKRWEMKNNRRYNKLLFIASHLWILFFIVKTQDKRNDWTWHAIHCLVFRSFRSISVSSAAHSSLWSLYTYICTLLLMLLLLLCVFACTINRMLINIGKMVMCLLSLCIHWPRNAANVYPNTYRNFEFGSNISRMLLYSSRILCWSGGEVISFFLSFLASGIMMIVDCTLGEENPEAWGVKNLSRIPQPSRVEWTFKNKLIPVEWKESVCPYPPLRHYHSFTRPNTKTMLARGNGTTYT